MMCFKKCLYGTLLDGVQKGEGRLAQREIPLLEKARWMGLITAGLGEHSGRGINHPGPMSPKSGASSKSRATGRRGMRHLGALLLSLGPRAFARAGIGQGCFPRRQVGEDTPHPPTPPQFPDVPVDFPSSVIKAEKPSTLRENPRGVEISPRPLPSEKRGQNRRARACGEETRLRIHRSGLQPLRPRGRQVYTGPVLLWPKQNRDGRWA